MTFDDLEREWRMRQKGRRRERQIVFGLLLVVALVVTLVVMTCFPRT